MGARLALPWEFFVTIGSELLGAAALFALLFPLGSTRPAVGPIGAGIFGPSSGALLTGRALGRNGGELLDPPREEIWLRPRISPGA